MEFTYTQTKEILKELGRFEIESYTHYGLTVINTENGEYAIGTEEEADDAWRENVESYIDDCVLCEIPEAYRSYFDYDKFFDACEYDGRGYSLSSYDGNEIEIADLVAFRIN